jgi:lipase chaperone LimK
MLLNRRTLPWLVATLVILGLAVGLNRWLSPGDAPAGAMAPEPTAAAQPGRMASEHAEGSPGMKQPIDLMGLKVDAARLFEIGYAGGLTIDGRTRETLEILLSNLPEEPSADDIERLEWTLRDGLPAADAQKAIALFHGYRAYLKDMRGEYLRLGIPANREEAQAFFAQMEAVQRRHFGADTAEAVFGDELRHSRLVMEASFVAQDASLSPEERLARLRALRAQLPPELQDSIPDEAAAAARAS